MVSIAHAIAAVVYILAGVGIVYTVVSAEVVRRKLAPSGPSAGADTPATMIKPLHGLEPNLEQDLAGFLAQDYAAPVQLLIGVQDPADPAVAAARRVLARFPEADGELVVDGEIHGSNRKISNLINLVGRARHELLVFSDADIAVGPDYLRRVAQAAAEPGVGVVTCLYFGQARTGFWSQLAAMGISYGFLPNVALGVAIGAAQPWWADPTGRACGGQPRPTPRCRRCRRR